MTIAIAPAHGWVVASIVGSWFVHHGYLAVKVMSARKKYGVNYPNLYASAENCKNEDHRQRFNCVQRAHQNALENQPAFLSLLLCAGLRFPITSSLAAAAYLLGRVLYMEGYATGNPDSRSRGFAPQYGGLLCLVGCAVRLAVELIRG